MGDLNFLNARKLSVPLNAPIQTPVAANTLIQQILIQAAGKSKAVFKGVNHIPMVGVSSSTSTPIPGSPSKGKTPSHPPGFEIPNWEMHGQKGKTIMVDQEPS